MLSEIRGDVMINPGMPSRHPATMRGAGRVPWGPDPSVQQAVKHSQEENKDRSQVLHPWSPICPGEPAQDPAVMDSITM